MTDWNTLRPRNTFGDLLHLDNGGSGVTGTLARVEDGHGGDTCLEVSTAAARITGDLTVSGTITGAAVTSSVTATGSLTSRSLADRFAVELMPEDFGALGDGTTSDSAAFALAFAALGSRGGVIKLGRKTYYLATTLTMTNNASLVGQSMAPGEDRIARDYRSDGTVIKLNSAATIIPAQNSCIANMTIIRSDIGSPPTDATEASAAIAAFAGTAITAGTPSAPVWHNDVFCDNLMIIGFAQAISSTGNERFRCRRVFGDCTNGISLSNVTDIAILEDCHFWPFYTTHRNFTTNANLTRSGTAYQFASTGDWSIMVNCFAYGYAVSFDLNAVFHCRLTNCGADYVGALASTSIGYKLVNCGDTILQGCDAAAQGTGIQVDVGGAVSRPDVTITGCNIWDCDTAYLSVVSGNATITGNLFSAGTGPLATPVLSVGASAGYVSAVGNIFRNVTVPTSINAAALGTYQGWANQFDGGTPSVSHRSTGAAEFVSNVGDASFSLTSASASGEGYNLVARNSTGTVSVPALLGASGNMLDLFGRGHDGTAYRDSCLIRFQADGTPAAGSMPGMLRFYTTPSASTTVAERLRIDATGTTRPGADNTYTLGSSSFRWSNFYSVLGTFSGNVGVGTGGNDPVQLDGTRGYVSVRGSTNQGVIEVSTAQADADAVVLGQFAASDVNSVAADKRAGIAFFSLEGTTATNRGGRFSVSTKTDAASGLTERFRVDAKGNAIAPYSSAAIATNATNGFLYIPSCAGTPTGAPTSYTGRVPLVMDTTNSKLYSYISGSWKSVTLA